MIPDEISPETQEILDTLIAEEMTVERVPGLSMAIVSKGKIIYTQNYGSKNLEERIPSDSDTLYRIASVTKSFICVGILQLHDLKKINIHDPISKYLPIKLGFEENPITIHHLMNHTSGIPDIVGGVSYHQFYHLIDDSQIPPFIPFTSWNDLYRHLNGAQEYITDIPGKRLYYFNIGYTLLGRIIELVSGMSLNEYLQQNIFSPLGMENSSFIVEDAEKTGNLSTPYKLGKNNIVEKTSYYAVNNTFGYAPGGLFSSINELSNYMIMILNNGEFNGKRILSEHSIKLMQEFHFSETKNSQLFGNTIGNFGKAGYGYGFGVHDDFYGHKLVHHSGSHIASSAWFAMIPDLNLGVIFLANKHPSPRMFALATLGLLLKKDIHYQFPILKNRTLFKQLTGVYHTYKSISKIKIVAKGGSLFFCSLDDKHQVPIHRQDDLLYYFATASGEKDPVEFEIDQQGQVWLHHERRKFKKIRNLDQ
ncbi:MAG: serine hydrolase [Candidatus Heimdallarchaeota archaeon]|nr:serine hydrolase [Candidatus Heimdallarchaeota archaeon]